MLKLALRYSKCTKTNFRFSSTIKENSSQQNADTKEYETVFTFPFVKYIAVLNRLKVYQLAGTSLAVPGCGLMEMLDVLPSGSFLATSYIGITGSILLSLGSLPFKDTIGYLYISEDNEHIKISSVDFWGKRKDKIVAVDDWIPLLDMAPKTFDPIFLSPVLADGTKYKLFYKFGNILNSKKMGQVLE